MPVYFFSGDKLLATSWYLMRVCGVLMFSRRLTPPFACCIARFHHHTATCVIHLEQPHRRACTACLQLVSVYLGNMSAVKLEKKAPWLVRRWACLGSQHLRWFGLNQKCIQEAKMSHCFITRLPAIRIAGWEQVAALERRLHDEMRSFLQPLTQRLERIEEELRTGFGMWMLSYMFCWRPTLSPAMSVSGWNLREEYGSPTRCQLEDWANWTQWPADWTGWIACRGGTFQTECRFCPSWHASGSCRCWSW